MSLRFAGAGSQKSIRIEWTAKFDKRYLDFVKMSGTIINEVVIHDLIVSAMGDAWREARANANKFKDTGFLMDHIFVYMPSNTEGILASTAEYSAAQEFGYRTSRGFVQGKHYMSGPFATAKKRIQEQFNILQKAFVAGIKADFKARGITVQVKSGFPQAVKKPTRSGFSRQATVRKRARYQDTGVFHVGRKRVQKRTIYRKAPRQLIGGYG